ncbi:MAG: diphosphomevalonate decarboxylase [Gammaproteobacteria bacterium]|nr:diphosphomevalonate decarboxylase [Gammaproteobacteria bacterium]MBT4492049.1 diphosphomevalonate decarboxylase [Gammaproteobacteria bacterium]
MTKTRVTVSAAANIALIKYWGKLEKGLNQPATASLSIGLEDLRTTTIIERIEGQSDVIDFNAPETARQRILDFLDLLRKQYEVQGHFHITTENNFPTGTGLASSASGFAALAIGFSEILNLNLSRQVLSQLARIGSGSAARSVFGGFVEIIPADDAFASRIMPAEDWPLAVIVAIASDGTKTVGSSEAMKHTAATSPYYREWLRSHVQDMDDARLAIVDRDFEKLADVAEHNCLKMHGAIITTRPPILYWLPATLAVMHEVRQLRESGTPAFFTIDAGAQVKVICPAEHAKSINARISELPGILRTIETRVGGEPEITAS